MVYKSTLDTTPFTFLQAPTIGATAALTTYSEYTYKTYSTTQHETIFGFGSMNSTATMNIRISRSGFTTVPGAIRVTVMPQPTQTLELGYPAPGPIAPSASSAPAVADVGAAPGFLFI